MYNIKNIGFYVFSGYVSSDVSRGLFRQSLNETRNENIGLLYIMLNFYNLRGNLNSTGNLANAPYLVNLWGNLQ